MSHPGALAASPEADNAPADLALARAVKEGAEANLRRHWYFIREDTSCVVELQCLKVPQPGRDFEQNWFAYARTEDEYVTLAIEGERMANGTCPAVYCIPGRVNAGVVTRAPRPGWNVAKKGESTTDADIETREVLYVDIDPRRPSGTSASAAQMNSAHEVTRQIAEFITEVIGDDDPVGVGHSGNGGSVLVALASLASTADLTAIVGDILGGLSAKFARPGAIEIDQSVKDPKRLTPCFGTFKRKGAAGRTDFPHRRSAFVCSNAPRRIGLDELLALRDAVKPPKVVSVPKVNPGPTWSDYDPFKRANDLPVRDVVEWLGLETNGTAAVRCPGCGEIEGSDILDGKGLNGVKCLHNRCSQAGKNGFRVAVDLVMAAKGLDAKGAANALAERFGFEGVRAKLARVAIQEAPKAIELRPVGIIAEAEAQSREHVEILDQILTGADLNTQLPPIEYLCKDLGLVGGGGAPHMVAGYGFSGKTMALQSLILSLVSATPAWEAYPVKHSLALHVDLEQGRELTQRRYQRLAKGMGISLEDKAGAGRLLGVIVMPKLSLTAAHERRWHNIMKGRTVIVVDSFRAATAGQKENDSQIREGLDMLGRISEETKCRAIVIHHARKTQDNPTSAAQVLRGSSSIFDACDQILVMSGGKGEPTKVECVKARTHGENIEDFALSITDVEGIDGDPKWGAKVSCVGLEAIADAKARQAEKQEGIQAGVEARRAREIIKGFNGIASNLLKQMTKCADASRWATVENMLEADFTKDKNGRFWMKKPGETS